MEILYGNFSKMSSIKNQEAGDLLTIRAVAKFHVKPEKIQEFIGLCKKLVEESVKEEGCIEYAAIPVLNKITCKRWLNILIFRNNFIALSIFTEYES